MIHVNEVGFYVKIFLVRILVSFIQVTIFTCNKGIFVTIGRKLPGRMTPQMKIRFHEIEVHFMEHFFSNFRGFFFFNILVQNIDMNHQKGKKNLFSRSNSLLKAPKQFSIKIDQLFMSKF